MTAATLIDQAVEAFISTVTPTPGITGVYEDRTQAYSHADAPAINISLTDADAQALGDQHPSRSLLRTTALVEMAIYTRGAIDANGREIAARSLASPIWAAAHSRLMADPSLGGKALRLRWRRSSWRKETADGTVGWATHTYELTLAMQEVNLLQPQ